jgi:predicted permease
MSFYIYQLKQALLSLKNKPGFVFSIVSTIGITLGGLLCVLTLAYVMLIKPLPYPEQDKLYVVEHNISDNKVGGIDVTEFTYPGLVHLYKNQRIFSESALVYYGQDVLTSELEQPTMLATYVTPEWFTMLNVPMELGRSFEQTEALDTNIPVALLTYNTWQNVFSADANILNKTLTFNNVSFRVIGVIAEHFIEPELSAMGIKSQIFLPWDFNPVDPNIRSSWANIGAEKMFVGKLNSNLSETQINQILTPLVNDTWQEKVAQDSFFSSWDIKIKARTLQSVILGDRTNIVYLLLLGVIGLVLIACANISNLFISRMAEKQQQLAIHVAVGATRHNVFKSIFVETSILMLLSALFALVIAFGGIFVMKIFLSQQLPRVDELTVNASTILLAIGISLLIALILSHLNSRMINYRALNSTLQSSGKATGVQVSKKLRGTLITSQVTVVTILVYISIGLFQNSIKIITQGLGFETNNIVSLNLSPATSETITYDGSIQVMKEFRDRLSQLPEIEKVSQSASPLGGFGYTSTTVTSTNNNFTPVGISVDNQYFNMISQPLIEGDYFTQEHISSENNYVIINDVFAKILAQEGNVIGMKIDFGDGVPLPIIGVVKGIKIPGVETIPMRVYMSSSLNGSRFLLKFKHGQTISREQVTGILRSVTSQYNLFQMRSLEERRVEMLFTQYTIVITTAALALLTLLLAAIGLYGILNYSIQMRRLEIGTRMAMGAKSKDIIGLVFRDNTSALVIGLVVSIAVLTMLHFGFSHHITESINSNLVPLFLMTLGTILLLSSFACYMPLRQYINKPVIHSLKGSE